jgi:large subunit ribosomal protein L37Ae
MHVAGGRAATICSRCFCHRRAFDIGPASGLPRASSGRHLPPLPASSFASPPTRPQLIRKIEVSQHAKYDCVFCGKKTVTRVSTGIWKCSACKKTSAGGSYVLTTPAAATVRSNIARMRKVAEGAEVVA